MGGSVDGNTGEAIRERSWHTLLRAAPGWASLQPIVEKLDRDRKLPPAMVMQKALRYVEGLAMSRFYLRECTQVGARARVRGKPYVENLGRIVLGDDVNLTSTFVPVHLVTGPDGSLEVGDGATINFGVGIAAFDSVRLGKRIRVGPYCMISDTDFHSATNREKRPTAPVRIGDDVWLAGRVTVLRGASIGDGTVISAGSVVAGTIPSGVIAGGVPARVLRRIDQVERVSLVGDGPRGEGTRELSGEVPVVRRVVAVQGQLLEEVRRVVAKTFAIHGEVRDEWGPQDIPRWDSLGQLHLVVALEESFGIRFSEEHLLGMVSIGAIAKIVAECLESSEKTALSGE